MRGLRTAGVLWVIGGLASAGVLPFVLDDLLNTIIFAAGAIAGIALGVLLLRRPSQTVITWSTIAGVAWLVVFGWLTITHLNQPIGELISVVVVGVFGVAGALLAYSQRQTAPPA
jgi:drug/metabolite transporter (DMT)-like permease